MKNLLDFAKSQKNVDFVVTRLGYGVATLAAAMSIVFVVALILK